MMVLIDRGQVMIDYLENIKGKNSYKAKYEALCKAVDDAPSVDAVPAVHGRWIPVYEEMETLVGVYPYTQVREVLTGWRCSVCGRCEGLPREEMPYCHCGAKMDEKEEGERVRDTD